MTNALILYYSSYGHIEAMADAQAEGARRVAHSKVVVKRKSGPSTCSAAAPTSTLNVDAGWLLK